MQDKKTSFYVHFWLLLFNTRKEVPNYDDGERWFYYFGLRKGVFEVLKGLLITLIFLGVISILVCLFVCLRA